ncbi:MULTISPECIES: TetR/AcrR family transcriptional regulator [Amycolatopsis]|uniref:TetR/AcrR family transcriptional regulator n=1 Tax=Amycolatopsis TaxID=1813 RepID=UPI001EF0272E|nr:MULTISPECIES: TetR/AcrR family transcriptional regulator [Amycolatopsis]MCF6425976.1 TetR/AcrR family transcriptional regulator [Amycolatopsis tucumanensis]
MVNDARRPGRPRTGVREAVLAAAEEILAEAGVARLSTKEVARRAGVAESSIFYHFRDRLGLLRAVVHLHLPRYKEVAEELGRRAGHGTVRDNLVELLGSLEAYYTRITPVLAAVQADSELRELFTQRSAEADIGPQRGLAPIAAYLGRERDLGRVRAGLDLDAAALVILGVAHQRAVLRSLGTPAVAGAAQVVDTLLPGLLPD